MTRPKQLHSTHHNNNNGNKNKYGDKYLHSSIGSEWLCLCVFVCNAYKNIYKFNVKCNSPPATKPKTMTCASKSSCARIACANTYIFIYILLDRHDWFSGTPVCVMKNWNLRWKTLKISLCLHPLMQHSYFSTLRMRVLSAELCWIFWIVGWFALPFLLNRNSIWKWLSKPTSQLIDTPSHELFWFNT